VGILQRRWIRFYVFTSRWANTTLRFVLARRKADCAIAPPFLRPVFSHHEPSKTGIDHVAHRQFDNFSASGLPASRSDSVE